MLLEERQTDSERKIVHYCLDQWLDIYKSTEPSPFSIINSLGESWWMQNAWGATKKLADGIPHSFILPGSKADRDSSDRRNNHIAPADRKKVGYKADILWRTIMVPDRDWGAGEAACLWDSIGQKYRYESSTHKPPCELHDILIGRSFELGLAELLQGECVSGLVFGGPVIQRVLLCWGSNLLRLEEQCISPSIANLRESIWGVRELLLFRASTVRLIETYERAKKKIADEEQERRRAEMRSTTIMVVPKKKGGPICFIQLRLINLSFARYSC